MLKDYMPADSTPAATQSRYREFAPSAALRESVLCFWTQTTHPRRGDHLQQVLPAACIDILFYTDRPPEIIGPWTKPFVARLAAGTSIVGVRLHPQRAANVLGLPANELLNAAAPMRSVWRKAWCERFEA